MPIVDLSALLSTEGLVAGAAAAALAWYALAAAYIRSRPAGSLAFAAFAARDDDDDPWGVRLLTWLFSPALAPVFGLVGTVRAALVAAWRLARFAGHLLTPRPPAPAPARPEPCAPPTDASADLRLVLDDLDDTLLVQLSDDGLERVREAVRAEVVEWLAQDDGLGPNTEAALRRLVGEELRALLGPPPGPPAAGPMASGSGTGSGAAANWR